MIDLIENFASIKSKVFDFAIEVIHALVLLFFASHLYGKVIDIDHFYDDAMSMSVTFFRDIIGILIAYLCVWLLSTIIGVCILFLIGEGRLKWIHSKRKRKIPDTESNFNKFKFLYFNSRLIIHKSYDIFYGMNDKQFKRIKEYYLNRKMTKQTLRTFVILTSFLIMNISMSNPVKFGWIDFIIILGILASMGFYCFADQLEEIIAQPYFLEIYEERSKVKRAKELIGRNKYCYPIPDLLDPKQTDNRFQVKESETSKVIGSIIIADKKFCTNWITSFPIWQALLRDGQRMLILDLFDCIPDSFCEEVNLKVVKDMDGFNLDKEVNEFIGNAYRKIFVEEITQLS